MVVVIALFASLNVIETEGRVIRQDGQCLWIRTDDNTEIQFCEGYQTDASRVRIRTFQLWGGLVQFGLLDEIKVTVLNESTEAWEDELSKMTLEQKLGQMMIVCAPEDDHSLGFVPGGYILFSRDFKGKSFDEIQEMTAFLQLQEYGALLMVDEEGGLVNRISSALYEDGFPSAQTLYRQGGWNAVEKNLQEKSELLKALGIQVNLNPVADVALSVQDYMYARTFGQSAEMTAEYVSMAVRIQKETGVMSCLKHFPGYANNSDTHTGLSIDERSLDEFRQRDFLPFASGIEAKAELVMMSHVIMKEVDEDNPASLSLKVHQLLKDELDYDGLIITDDLTMDAIEQRETNVLISAINAGNDLILTTDPQIDFESLVMAAKQGMISMNQVDESVLKILKIKEIYGVLEDFSGK